MTTKASPPATATTSVAAQPAAAAAAAAPATESTTPTTGGTGGVQIKKEIANDEIKDFAETAMNELLGWYGYENVDLSTKSSRLMSSSSLSANPIFHRTDLNGNQSFHRDESNTTSDADHDSSREDDSKSPCSTKTSDKLETNCGWCRRIVPENSPEFLTTTDGPRYCSESCFAQSRRASFKRAKQCDWCRHIRHAVSYVDFQDGASQLQFCSDKCLNQYKMQIFCKETQAHLDMNPHLKDKCNDLANSGSLITPELWLKNCRSRSLSPASDDSGSPTPLMPAPSSGSSAAAALGSGNGILLAGQHDHTPHKPIISLAPVSKLMSKHPDGIGTATTTVLNSRQSPKHGGRKKRLGAGLTRTGLMQNLSCNNNNNNNINNSNNNNISSNNHLANSHNTSTSANSNNYIKSNKCLINNPSASKAPLTPHPPFPTIQDLRLNVPSISPNDQSGPHQLHGHPRPNLPPHAYFFHSPNNFPPPQMRSPFLSPAHLQSRLMGVPPHQHQQHQHQHHQQPQPQQQPQQQHQQHYPPPPHHPLQTDLNPLAVLIGTAPPVTVMVPYPVIIPLPVPIPIPLPILSFLRAANLPTPQHSFSPANNKKSPQDGTNSSGNVLEKVQIEKTPTSQQNTDSTEPLVTVAEQTDEIRENCRNDEPLDFTKSKITQTDSSNVPAIRKTPDLVAETTTPLLSMQEDAISVVVEQISETNVDEDGAGGDSQDSNYTKQKVPKFKITRLHTKRLITKESECSRPLRKRKRIIDCDYNVTRSSREDEDCSKMKK